MRIHGLGWLIGLGLLSPVALSAQAEGLRLPFGPGEEMVYQVRVSPMGTVGQGTMGVDAPEAVRGHETYLLRFDFTARVGPLRAAQQTRSWVDAGTLATLRFHKHEKQPLARDVTEEVEVYPGERRWAAADGAGGRTPTATPLDELSFLYYIRTLPLEEGEEHRLDRHFDPDRSPVVIRVIRREEITVPAGTFATVLVEMRVRDPKRYEGEGRILMHLRDDERRTPIRIETALPGVGSMTLNLESVRTGRLAQP